jgi:hypothetical protein
MVRKSPAILSTVLNIPVRAVGRLQRSLVLMLDDNGATENLDTHALADKLKLVRVLAMVLIAAAYRDFKQQQKHVYLLEVVDAKGVGRQIHAIGMRSIIDIGHVKGVMALERLF